MKKQFLDYSIWNERKVSDTYQPASVFGMVSIFTALLLICSVFICLTLSHEQKASGLADNIMLISLLSLPPIGLILAVLGLAGRPISLFCWLGVITNLIVGMAVLLFYAMLGF